MHLFFFSQSPNGCLFNFFPLKTIEPNDLCKAPDVFSFMMLLLQGLHCGVVVGTPDSLHKGPG